MEMRRRKTVFVGVVCCLAAFVAGAAPMEPRGPLPKMQPLTVSENGRFLVEKGGKPFFILADTAWALFSGVSREDVKFYLDDRKARGFNTIICSFLHFWPTEQGQWAPKHRVYGFWAFDGDHYDLTRPNKQYWRHVDWVVQQARQRSLRLAIVPACSRRAGGSWPKPLTGTSATAFGEYLGIRCCQYNNILWLFDGDSPLVREKRALRLLAEGIRYYAPHHLISYQAKDALSNGVLNHRERWLAFNSIRTRSRENDGEYALVQQNWHRVPAKPTWLAEPYYERPGSRFAVRQAAWRSALNGGAGFGYGVNNMFGLGGDGGWKERLDMPGGSDVVHMLQLLESQPWHKLVPDHAAKTRLLAAVDVWTEAHFPAACSSDGDFGVIYMPRGAAIGVNMGKFKGRVMGRWFSPTTGQSAVVDGSPFINAGVHTIRSPEPNAVGESDLVLVLTASAAAEAKRNRTTLLGINREKFTINGEETFLFGISYYGVLGAQSQFVLSDLDDMQKLGINWIRVWATWGAFGNDVTAFDKDGRGRVPYITRLKQLVAECDRRGIVVDVTLSRGNGVVGQARLQSLKTHMQAVETVATELKEHRNWYLDLGNERNIRDGRYVSMTELKRLREAVEIIDPERLVTASRAGDIPRLEVVEYVEKVGVDFISPHRPRSSKSASQTAERSREYLRLMKDIGTVVPLHYQEPFRRGFTKGWEPTVEDFVTDARGALEGGAAGWCLHNGDQKDQPESRPRRSFDLREQRLFDQLDEVEKEALKRISELVRRR